MLSLSCLMALSMGVLPAVFTPDPFHSVWSTTPAVRFTESTPLGNGRLGMMVFGDPVKEHIVLNESTVWSGGPHESDREDAWQVLPEIRRLLLDDKNREAQNLLQRNFVCKGVGSAGGKNGPFGCYQILANLDLEFSGFQPNDVNDYRRHLDLRTGIATTEFSAKETRFVRRAFVSAPHEVDAIQLTASKPGSISFRMKMSRAEAAKVTTEGTDLVLSGQLQSGVKGVEGVRFSSRVRVRLKGGTLQMSGEGISVMDADEALVLVGARTSMFEKAFGQKAKEDLDRATKISFARLESSHVRDYQSFYNRVSLELPVGPSAMFPTVDRLKASQKPGSEGDDPSLAGLYFNFGRYLLISSSRPNGPLPANLQGIWAEEYQTPWNADFHLNINVQMNYWPAEVANLGDCHRPLIDFVSKLVPNGQKTAKAYYGSEGWVAHVVCNPWHFTSPGEGADWGSTVTGGGWLCQHLWERFEFSGDKKYLASVYPTMKGSARFFLDMLIQDPKTGYLVTAPSNSPENAFIHPKDGPVNTCMSPTIDNQIIRELFTNVIKASELLGIDADFRAQLIERREKLPPMKIGKKGQLLEWLNEYEEQEPKHRHVSHLYGLHPSNQISPAKTPELADAARRTLELRGDDGTGWSLAWKVCFWARLLDGDHSWKMLKYLFRPVGVLGYGYMGGGSYANLFDAHPPFQIDGNFGATAGIQEMLLQSSVGEVTLLPALPKAWGKSGRVRGFKIRGGQTVDFEWQDGKITSRTVKGRGAKNVKVKSGLG